MTVQFNDLAGGVSTDGAVTPEEMADLRKSAWQDGRMTSVEIDTMILANDQLRGSSQDWSEFFAEALSEYALNDTEPKGYVDDTRSRWIASRITTQGTLAGMEELEAVVRILERATNVGDCLRDLAIGAIEKAALEGTGPTRSGENTAPAGRITSLEAGYLRRIVFAPASERPAAVGKREAELLFRIKDATLDGENGTEWPGLFVQGVASYLQGFGGAEPLTAGRAKELESFMNDQGANLSHFFARMARSDVRDGFGSLLGEMAPEDEYGDDELAQATRVTPDEASWLDAMLDADEDLDDLERDLLRFLSDDGA